MKKITLRNKNTNKKIILVRRKKSSPTKMVRSSRVA